MIYQEILSNILLTSAVGLFILVWIMIGYQFYAIITNKY